MEIDKRAFNTAIDVLAGEFPPESGITIEVLKRLCAAYEAAKTVQPDELTLLGVLADIRQKTRLGDKVMLSDLADTLAALIQNGDSAIDTNVRLTEMLLKRESGSGITAEQLIDRLRLHVKNTKMGEEHLGRGSSTYNWGKHYISVLELLLGLMSTTHVEDEAAK